MTFWCVGTLGHFLLTARWLNRAGGPLTRDDIWFRTMVVGTGTLSIALHLMASTAGLSIPRVLLVLAVGHAIAAWLARGTEVPGLSPAREARAETPALQERTLEVVAIVALTAVVIQWTMLALHTAEVSGADAAHYHVPNAVNLALGASPFDLPPTSHLYPMGSSTLAAWFILPVQTTLLTDLTMVLPFLLLMSASALLFRQLTALSGLAWSTWMMLVLFSTPLFRSASLMSADLLFAAASMAFATALLSPLLQRELKAADIWLIALSLGLLLGSKVTGIVVAALLGIPAIVALAVLMVQGKWTWSSPGWVSAGAALAVIGAGGIWLVRNWWVWGSPVAPNGMRLFGFTLFPGAPYEATTYLSVLGDMAEKTDYRLWDRAHHFIKIWLSSWYLLGLGLLALIPIDAIASRGRVDNAATRLWAMTVAAGTGVLVTWFLIGAPWTSLEWTAGFSLRYAIPWLAMLPLVAWVGLFPVSVPWYRRTAFAVVGGAVISVGSVAIFASHHQLAFPPMPTPTVLIAALTIVVAWRAIQFAAPRWTTAFAISVVLATSILLGVWMSRSDVRAQETRSTAIAQGPRTQGERVYDAAIAREAADGHSCDAQGRRFFVTNRFDEAGALQGARLTNQVFYAARDVRVTTNVRPAMGPCDYLLTERPIMGTDKGAALHAGLNTSGVLAEVASVGDVVLLVHR
ncbi:MAG: hypothetical protein ABIP90_12390 [Vicinamibacterales bacterium]